ncbi:response regulator transcription factor [uncultured Actinomyces sp.]|uniref:response regulator n=1 Tax=uncultured Actinomyces sp. TaxID=249061 RepID=UPI00261DBE86|nr:response regulator transcription factor [uncultured Actinomyces sp.]
MTMKNSDTDSTIRVMVVDDHEIVRYGITELIGRTEGFEVVAEAGSVQDAITRADLTSPDVMLVDLQLPDGTGIEIMNHVKKALPDTKCVVLTSFDDDEALAESCDAGAKAFILKKVRGAEVTRVIRLVHEGKVLLDEKTITRKADNEGDILAALTPAERRIVGLISKGMTNAEIGEQLGISEKTVKNHITSLLSKMGLKRRTQVMAWAAGQQTAPWRTQPSP